MCSAVRLGGGKRVWNRQGCQQQLSRAYQAGGASSALRCSAGMVGRG